MEMLTCCISGCTAEPSVLYYQSGAAADKPRRGEMGSVGCVCVPPRARGMEPWAPGAKLHTEMSFPPPTASHLSACDPPVTTRPRPVLLPAVFISVPAPL